jgi:hypothetical protein
MIKDKHLVLLEQIAPMVLQHEQRAQMVHQQMVRLLQMEVMVPPLVQTTLRARQGQILRLVRLERIQAPRLTERHQAVMEQHEIHIYILLSKTLTYSVNSIQFTQRVIIMCMKLKKEGNVSSVLM